MINREKENIKKNKTKIVNFAVYATVITTVLYVLGYYYVNGYLTIYGLNNDYYNQDLYFYLIKGYEGLVGLVSSYIIGWIRFPIVIALLGLFIFFASFVIQILNYFFENYVPKDNVNNGNIKNQSVPKVKLMYKLFMSTIFTFFGVISTIVIPVGFMLILYIPYVSGYKQGGVIAKSEIKEFKNCNYAIMNSNEKCIQVIKGGKVILEGIFIAKSSNSIALWTKSGLVIQLLKDEKLSIKYGIMK